MILIAAIAFSFQSCKTENSTTAINDDSAMQMQQSNDESMQKNESQVALNDASNAMENTGFGKTFSISGASIDSVVVDKKLTITYNGNNAEGNRFRSGQIIVQLTHGDHWKDENAVITITFINYKVTRILSGISIIFNGTWMITNVSGGLVRLLTAGTFVTHRVNGSMNITFDDGTQRTWTITCQRIIGLTNAGVTYISISGFGTKDNLTNLLVTGTNRAGISFYTIITSPIVLSSTCSWLPVSGTEIHKGIAKEISVTFGVDEIGNPVTPPACPYGFKISWISFNGMQKQAVINY